MRSGGIFSPSFLQSLWQLNRKLTGKPLPVISRAKYEPINVSVTSNFNYFEWPAVNAKNKTCILDIYFIIEGWEEGNN